MRDWQTGHRLGKEENEIVADLRRELNVLMKWRKEIESKKIRLSMPSFTLPLSADGAVVQATITPSSDDESRDESYLFMELSTQGHALRTLITQ